eukprot:s50_g64.t1
MFPCHGFTKLPPNDPKLRSVLDVTLTSKCIAASSGVHLDRFGPSSIRFIGSKITQLLGPSWAPFEGSRAQAGPNPGQFCGHAENVQFIAISNFFAFDPNIGPVLGPTLAPDATKLRMLSPTCAQMCPSCAMLEPISIHFPFGLKLGPSWSQLARVRRKCDPSWVQVGSFLAQLTAKDGQV